MASIQVNVPDWLDRILAWPVMRYRRRKYGYSFRRIYLGEGEWTIVDAEDYYRLGNLKWCISGNRQNFYATRNVKAGPGRTKIVYLHREIMKPPKGLVVDHRNGDTLDNLRSNLRLATFSENMQNRRKRKNTSSRFIGVFIDKRCGRCVAQIIYQGRKITLGRFDNEMEAAKAYDEAAKRYRGEFARLNFPEEAPVSSVRSPQD
jgi:hypothetical protein